MSDPIRLGILRPVPEVPLETLADDVAVDSARAAFAEARDAQLELTSNLHLSKMLFEPGRPVTYYRLLGMRAEAQRQAKRATVVLAGIETAIEAMERSEAATTGRGRK